MTRRIEYGPSVEIDMGGNKITNVADGVDPSDAATVSQITGGGAVDSVFGRTGTVVATAGDYTAAEVTNVPAGGIAAVTVQAALNELDTEKLASGASAGGVLDGTFPNPGLAAGVAGAGLAESSDVLSVNVDGTTIEITADVLNVKSGVFDAAGAAAAAQAASQPLDADLTALSDLNAATGKTTPVDADQMPVADSAASFAIKKLTWANLKATIKAYTDTLYDATGAAAAAQSASQPLDSDLTAIAGLSPTNDDVVQRKAGAWTNRSIAQLVADEVATPAIVLGSSAAAGSAGTLIRSDSTIAAFDTTNPTTQAFGDAAAVGSAAFAARRDHKHAMPANPNTPIFDSTLAVDTAAIDTGAGGIPGTFNILEVWIYARSDNNAVTDSASVTVNNDTAGNYDRSLISLTNATVTGSATNAAAAWNFIIAAASCTAGVFTVIRMTIPCYAQTTGNKVAEVTGGVPDQTAANMRTYIDQVEWRSTAAITRLTVTANAAGKKLVAGSRLLIYGR